MSSVRMCNSLPFCVNDASGQEPWRRIFSEDADGWTTGTMILNRRDGKTGRTTSQEVAQDTCPDCADARFGIRHSDKVEEARAAKMDPAYVDWLERQTKVGQYAALENGD